MLVFTTIKDYKAELDTSFEIASRHAREIAKCSTNAGHEVAISLEGSSRIQGSSTSKMIDKANCKAGIT
jgi:hypothetical protein